MEINLNINGTLYKKDISPSEDLFTTLRSLRFHGVKFGDEQGLSGSDTVLLDGRPINAGSIFSLGAEGHNIITIEGLGENPEQGWKKTEGLHPLQLAFIETGALQCGYCTPAQILAAKALLDKNPSPTEKEIREAISGVLCRCTGYEKPVKAIMLAAARLRGEKEPVEERSLQSSPYKVVGRPEPKVDAIKLVQGKSAFTADIELRGLLHAKVLHSPYAHARITRIETTLARALPGVAAVLTWKDIPRVVYSTAGQSDPIPGPLDTFSLDTKVRFVGDRVAFVAA